MWAKGPVCTSQGDTEPSLFIGDSGAAHTVARRQREAGRILGYAGVREKMLGGRKGWEEAQS